MLPTLKPDFSKTNPATDEHRATSIHVRQSLARTLAQSVDLKDLAYEAAMELKLEASPEQEDGRRARCQAVAAAIKAWGKLPTNLIRSSLRSAMGIMTKFGVFME